MEGTEAINLSGSTIFVVEDEVLISKFYEDEIRKCKGRVIVADGVKHCKEMLDAGTKFDVMLLDINLSEGSGFDVLEKIVSEKIPAKVIVCTGYGFYPDIAKSIAQFGVAAKLLKPLPASDVVLECYTTIQSGRYVCDEHNNDEVRRLEDEMQRHIKNSFEVFTSLKSKRIEEMRDASKGHLAWFRKLFSRRDDRQAKEDLVRINSVIIALKSMFS